MLANILDELISIFEDEKVKIKFTRANVSHDVNRDFQFRTLLLLLILLRNEKNKSFSMNIMMLKLVQFIALNRNYEKKLIEFVLRNKMSKHVVGDAFELPDDFKLDNLFDEVLRYLYIARWISWKDSKNIELTELGIKKVLEFEKIIVERKLFVEIFNSIEKVKDLKITNKMLGIS